MRKELTLYLALISVILCSCSITTTSGGKRVVTGPKEFFEEQTKNLSDASNTFRTATELPQNNSEVNPENFYPTASDDASIVYELKSNWERTHFFVDSKEMGVARNLKIKINNNEHTVIAKPDGCISKEENIRPPYDSHAPLSFIFLIGECTEEKSINKKKIILQKSSRRNQR